MSVGTLTAYLGLHLGRCRVMLTGNIGFLLGLSLYLLLLGTIRGDLLEHDAFGEDVFCVHMVMYFSLLNERMTPL